MKTETRQTDSKPVETLAARPSREDAVKKDTNPPAEDSYECDLPPLKPLPRDFSDGVLCGVLGMEALIILIVIARHIVIRIAQ